LILAPLLVASLMLITWQAWVVVYDVPVYLVPSPVVVAATLARDWPVLASALLTTLKISSLAMLVALFLGTGIACLFAQSRVLEVALYPYAILLQVTPIVAIAPLIIIWVKNPTTALVICATVVALFPVIANTSQGLRSLDPGLLEFFRLHRASRWQTLWRLRVPSALPYFFAGLKVSSGLALIGAVVAEFVAGTGGTSAGLAYQILLSGLQLNIPRMFAALVLIAAAGVAQFTLVSALAWLCLRHWHESEVRV
jgi:NitT/TauT family transport system permease protein